LPVSSFVVSTPDASGGVTHEVAVGQSAWAIASNYGIDLAVLLDLNGLTADSILHPGDLLIIYPPATPTIAPTIPPTGMPTLTPVPSQVAESSPEFAPQPASEEGGGSSTVLVLSILGTLLVVVVVMMFRLRRR
jgi:LysM repeat protein